MQKKAEKGIENKELNPSVIKINVFNPSIKRQRLSD